MQINIKRNECPSDHVANLKTVQNKQIIINCEMAKRLFDKAVASGEQNAVTTLLPDGNKKKVLTIPGVITTFLEMIEILENGKKVIFLTKLRADDIPTLTLNEDYTTFPGHQNVIVFDYIKEKDFSDDKSL